MTRVFQDGEVTDEEDWCVHWENDDGSDFMEYYTLEEAIASFKESMADDHIQNIYLRHYTNYIWEGDEDGNGWFTNPSEDTLLYWEGEDDPNNPLAEQMENLLSEVTA